jgi:hypothetical protein
VTGIYPIRANVGFTRLDTENTMEPQTGNLSPLERAISALGGVVLSGGALRARGVVSRALMGFAGASLLARAAAGHCAVKSAITGHSSLKEGVADQWRCMVKRSGASRYGLPGSPVHHDRSQAVDEAVAESFPASDPPASRLPDEPPINADAKWEAAANAKASGRRV